MRPVAKYNKLISFWVEDDVADALTHVAKANGLTASAVARDIFESYFTYIGAIRRPQPANGHTNEIRA